MICGSSTDVIKKEHHQTCLSVVSCPKPWPKQTPHGQWGHFSSFRGCEVVHELTPWPWQLQKRHDVAEQGDKGLVRYVKPHLNFVNVFLMHVHHWFWHFPTPLTIQEMSSAFKEFLELSPVLEQLVASKFASPLSKQALRLQVKKACVSFIIFRSPMPKAPCRKADQAL